MVPLAPTYRVNSMGSLSAVGAALGRAIAYKRKDMEAENASADDMLRYLI